ncbi:MAG TPA: ribulose-phosphate 3-epimerase, partial [Ignavibacteriales bacterium]|nr:ribulose-phosphate 3-epimerase [Ignavibacteriales bacterium]
DVFVAGSSIFKADNITAATAELKNILKANI